MGTGKITLLSSRYGADIVVDVTDASHCVIRDDQLSLVIFGLSFLGSETYQVTFPAGIVLSASGSKCGALSDYTFTTMAGTLSFSVSFIDSEKPYPILYTPASFSMNLPTNTIIRIAFNEYVKPNTGSIVFKNAEKNIVVNVENAREVKCVKDVCSIEPMFGFEQGAYEMTFSENAFVDYSGNTLVSSVDHIMYFMSDVKCGLEFVNVDANSDCYCQSKDNQCQCQCGETYFVKEY